MVNPNCILTQVDTLSQGHMERQFARPLTPRASFESPVCHNYVVVFCFAKLWEEEVLGDDLHGGKDNM